MKPITLKIQGLNSFEEEQSVDFRRLTANGIFGVFGPTGSGKSTIVDAMTLALYGEASRYDGEKGGRQFINTHCDTMSVSFEFALTDGGKDIHYVAERTYKKKDDTVRMSLARLFQKSGSPHNEIRVLADKTSKVTEEVSRLIGLSYDDFTRSVILPQGKFSQFLLLANKERRDMLERLFKLEKYGERLSRKIRQESGRVKTRLEIVENTLEIYADATCDRLSAVEASLLAETQQLAALKQAAAEKTTAYEDAKDIQQLDLEYSTYTSYKQECDSRQPEITAKKSELAAARRAGLVKPHIIRVEESNKKLIDVRIKIEEHIHQEKQANQKHADAKKAYENAAAIRDSRYPLLLLQESNLKRAIQLSAEKHTLAKAHQTLRREYQIKKETADLLSTQCQQKETERNDLRQLLAQITQRKSQINIPSNFREKIAQGLEIQKKRLETEKTRNTVKAKVDTLSAAVESTKKTLFDLEDGLRHVDTQIERHTRLLEESAKTCPGDEAYLASQKAALAEYENRLSRNMEKLERWQSLKTEQTELLRFLAQTSNALDQYTKNIAQTEQHLADNKDKLTEAQSDHLMYEAAKKLTENEPCPVCGSLHHPDPARLVTDSMLNALLEKKQTLEQTLAEQTGQQQTALIQEAAARQTTERLLVEIKAAENDLKGFEPDAEALKYQQKQAAHQLLQSRIEAYEARKQETESALQILIQTQHANSLTKAKLAGILSTDEKNLLDFRTELQNSESEIRQWADKLSTAAEQAGTSDFEAWEKKIKAFDIERSKLEKEEEKYRKQENKLTGESEEMHKSISMVRTEMEGLTVKGLQKKEALEKISAEIEALSSCQDPEEAMTALENEMKAVHETWETTKRDMENRAVKNQTLLEMGAGLRKQEETLSEINSGLQKALEASLADNFFATKEEALQYYLEPEAQVAAEQLITAHEDRLKAVLDHLDRLNAKLRNRNTRDISHRVSQLQDELVEIHKNIEHKTKNTAIMREQVKKLSSDIQKADALTTQKKELESANDLLTDMAGLFAGNRFVEYVARRYLRYVTAEASVRLKEMTSGRYALEIDGTDFVVRDDYAGGARRSPKTLSGGETFMASLCLSLALSSKIQLKNNASLAFFFLDEGFGTLDPASLDVVMDALEKLRLEDLKVGIISHVEELKSRIAARLVVTPAEQGVRGTVLRIE